MKRRFFIAIACVMALALAGAAGAASVRPLALGEIIDTAAVAFEGTCIGNRTERDASTNMVVTYTTFAVKDVLKGQVQGTTHVIKQVGGKIADGEPSFNILGVPTFNVGQDYVVFLAGVSSAGFSSPIGLAQGNFRVLPDAAGARVFNGRDFRALTADLPAALLPPAAAAARVSPRPVQQLGLDEFKQMVRARIGGPR